MLQQHRHFIIVVTILIVVMTFPTIIYVFNTEVFWLPTGNHTDTWMKVWDAWYGKRMLAGQADYYYTDLLFYPHGVSLVYHNFSIPHMLVFGGLQAFMPMPNAYSLTFLLIVAAVTCSAYIYMLYLFKDKWIALLGAVIIGLSPHVVGYPEHPEYRFIATVPLAMYFLHRGLAERHAKLVFFGAVTTGLTAYSSLHVSVCLVVMLGMMFCYFLASRWNDKRFWGAALLFAATAAAISAPRILPMIASAEDLEAAIDYLEINDDLLEYFINARHPLVRFLFPDQSFHWGARPTEERYTSYLGFSVLFLVFVGFLSKTRRRKMLPWLLMALPFLLLRLGSELTIGGVNYPHILLPKHFLDEWLPAVTQAFRLASAFYLGVLIPLAILACYGASALLRKVGAPRATLFVTVLIAIVCFEYYQPVRPGIFNESELAFVDWLAEEPGDLRLIHLPIDKGMRFKSQLYQTFHGFPVAQGIIARKSPEAYSYIYNNHLLASWHLRQVSACFIQKRDKHLPALSQLIADGFTHVIWHKRIDADTSFWVSLAGAKASYADDHVNIYRINDLLQPCDPERLAEHFSAFPYADIYLRPSIIHERNGLVMSLHPSLPAHEAFLQYFSQITFDRKEMVHITYNDADERAVQSSHYSLAYLENITGSYNGIWLINDPQETDLSQMPVFHSWLEPNYMFCRRVLDRADATIDLYLKPNIPCEALDDRSKFDVLYDNGARLRNLSYDVAANRVTFYLAWTITPERDYAFSIQFFDGLGEKAHQYDNAVFHDLVTAHGVDISSLTDGAYDMKLIVYDPATGHSASGTVIESGLRFERFLDIGTIELSQS